MKRKVIEIDDLIFDVKYVDCIRFTDNNKLIIEYNKNQKIFEFDSVDDLTKKKEEIINKMVEYELVLLYDNDRDIINYSNIITFSKPKYDHEKLYFDFKFKSGIVGYINLYYNVTGDNKDNIKNKMTKIYDELLDIWLKDEPNIYKPFHKIDLIKNN